MAIDWSYAALISVVGFGMVFIILLVLAFAIWLTGKVINRINTPKPAASNEKSS
jgi:sodium pump decarboxylase gamma subunit